MAQHVLLRFSWILLEKYTSLAKHSMSLKHVECPISKSRVCCKPIMPFLIFLFTKFYKVLNFFTKSNITFCSRVSSPWAKWLKMADRYHLGGRRPPYMKLKLIVCRFTKYMMEML